METSFFCPESFLRFLTIQNVKRSVAQFHNSFVDPCQATSGEFRQGRFQVQLYADLMENCGPENFKSGRVM